ncbi:MAG: DMT family transporter [Gammaproteobacteria bacterium]|nr:DMT family transporter [Gammaproteobacteria bacterium]
MKALLSTNILSAIVSALFFSFAASVAPLYYAAGGGVFLLLCIRYTTTLLLSSALDKPSKKKKTKSLYIRLITISILQAVFVGCYMYSLKLIPLSLAVVVIYTFPLFTFFANSVIKSRSIDLISAAALFISLAGIWLMVQGDATNWNGWGVFWGTVASIAQTGVNILSRHDDVEPGWGLIKYLMVLPTAIFALIYFIITPEPIASVSYEMIQWSLMSAAGMIGGFYFFFYSIAKIGPVRTSNVMFFEPVFTIMIGILIFQNNLALMQWLGILVIIVATSSLEMWGKKYS